MGVLAGDTATVTLNTGSAVGTFASSSVGTGITVNVSGLTLNGGATALNYTPHPALDDGQHHRRDAHRHGHHGQQQALR